jgi:hypothetical protein
MVAVSGADGVGGHVQAAVATSERELSTAPITAALIA